MPEHTQYQPVLSHIAATIDSSEDTSDAIDLMGTTLCGVYLPSTFTGSSISFEVASEASGSFVPLYKNGALYSISVSTDTYQTIDVSDVAGIRHLKIVSSGTEAAERTLTLAVRSV